MPDLYLRLVNLYSKVRTSSLSIVAVALAWLLFRTGIKPSRITYPCQRAAANTLWLALSSLVLSLIPNIQRISGFIFSKRIWVVVLSTIIVAGGTAYWWNAQRGEIEMFQLTLNPRSAIDDPASDIFVVNGATGQDNGLNQLIELMGSQELHFYQSGDEGTAKGSNGLISRDDVVLIKVNCQWPDRGGTNTDLLKDLVELILNHPDVFVGEIIIADNGQGGGSLDWDYSNAEDQSQSVQKVVDLFSNSHNVSLYLWDDIRGTSVEEYDSGNLDDGYVVEETSDPETGLIPSYPKFKTDFGTYVSFKNGIWDSSSNRFDREKLKILNVPVLKTHSIYGVTASVKHYMGVVSQPLTNAHATVGKGGMGTELGETRVPTLNILDAIWINAVPVNGPATSYQEATRVNVILASTDPIALDYWAAKHILMQTASLKNFENLETLNPDSLFPGSFGDWLRLSMHELLAGGYQVTANEDNMNVYITNI